MCTIHPCGHLILQPLLYYEELTRQNFVKMVFKKVSVLTQDTSRISCAPDIIKNSPKKGPSLLGQYNWIMYFFK